MISETNVRFIKLKNGENIVAHVEEKEDFISLERPIALVFDTFDQDDEDQQIISIKEWVPPLIAKFVSVPVDRKDIFFILEVQASFIDHYLDVSNAFFTITPEENRATRLPGEDNVFSIEDILKNMKKH